MSDSPPSSQGTPLVSVVIPSYNRAPFVGEAIDSALSQEGVATEVIVVDDGSTDDTVDRLVGYGDRIRYTVQQNAGAPAARNTGCEMAKGKWVAFLDSDDVFLPGKLARQLSDLGEHPDAIAHFTNVEVDRDFARDTTIFDLRKGLLELFGDRDALYLARPLALNAQHNFARLQGSLIRRDAVFSCGLSNPEYSSFNDTELLNRVALEGPWVVTSRVFAREIRRSEETVGVGEARIKKPFTGFINLHRQTDALLRDPRITEDERSQLEQNGGRYAFYAATSLIRFGRREEARRYLRTAFQHVPSPRTALTYLLTFAPQMVLNRLFH